MTMVFDVRPAVDLSRIQVGQDIRFTLVQEHAGEYVIEQIHSGENEPGEMSEVQSDQSAEPETPSANKEHRDD